MIKRITKKIKKSPKAEAIEIVRTSIERIADSLEKIANHFEKKTQFYKKADENIIAKSVNKNQLEVTFPKMTLKEIFDQSKGNTEKGNNLIWNFKNSWVRSEPFFETETTNEGKKLIDLEIIGTGKDWNECKEIADKSGKRILNMAELIWLCWKHEDIMRPILNENNPVRWTWTSTKTVDADLGDAGGWGSDGLTVGWDVAGYSDSGLGLGFSCTDL